MIGFTGSGDVLWIGDLYEEYGTPVELTLSAALAQAYSATQQLIIYVPAEFTGFDALAQAFSAAGTGTAGVVITLDEALAIAYAAEGRLFTGAKITRPVGQTSVSITSDQYGITITV